MPKMTAAEAAIRMLESEGVDFVFGQPGAAILPFYQIASGQFQRVNHPRRYLVCGQAGPLGWEIPACIGAKLAEPEREVLAVVGDPSMQFLIEELAVAVQHRVGFAMLLLNNAYLGLLRQL